MENKKKNKKLAALATGTLVLGAFSGIGTPTAEAGQLGFSVLGSGGKVRSSLLASTDVSSSFGSLKELAGEGKCGEGKCGGDDKDGGEGKCGEGKCGGDKDGDKDGGEGKCG